MTEMCGWCLKRMTQRDARNHFICTCPDFVEHSRQLAAELEHQHRDASCGYCLRVLRNGQCTCPPWVRASLESAIDHELQVQLSMAPDSPNRTESERILNELTQGADRQWARDRVAKLREAHARRMQEIEDSLF